MLIYNAHFYLDGGFDNEVRALLVLAGRISARFHGDPPEWQDTERLDLSGAWVYPGFIDAHTHSFSGGLYQSGIDLSGCDSLDDVLSLLSDADKEPGETIFAWRFDESLIPEQRFPTLQELDAACPRRPLLLRRVDGHSCLLNSRARELLPGLNTTDEVLTGEANDQAVNWLQDNCHPDAILQAYHAAAQAALRGGFTRVHTMIGDADQSNQHYGWLRYTIARFPVAFELYPQSFNIAKALELGSRRIGGCILADGSLGSHTAALSEPYADRATTGRLYHMDGFWHDFIAQAHAQGLQVCVHCIGDAAIHQINNAYARLPRDEVIERRHQLIHCELTPGPLVAEIAASGATPVMQPAFDLLWGGDAGFYTQRLGVERSRQMNRWGSFTRAGVRVCGSSDWYVTPLDIAMSLHAAINHHNPAERLTPRQAIDIYTQNNAWLAGDEHRYGHLAPGLDADFTVTDTDFTQPFDPAAVRILRVIRRGETVYAAD